MKMELYELIYNTLSPILTINLSESDSESYPYGVYTTKDSELRCKSGVYALEIILDIDIVGDNFSVCQEKSKDVYNALIDVFSTSDSCITLTNRENNSSYGVWTLTQEFKIIKNI